MDKWGQKISSECSGFLTRSHKFNALSFLSSLFNIAVQCLVKNTNKSDTYITIWASCHACPLIYMTKRQQFNKIQVEKVFLLHIKAALVYNGLLRRIVLIMLLQNILFKAMMW